MNDCKILTIIIVVILFINNEEVNFHNLSGQAYKNLHQNPILYSCIDSIGLSGSSTNLTLTGYPKTIY